MDQFERAATRAIVTCGPKEAVERLGVNADDGLAAQEVDRRRQISGPNELAKTEEETACAKFLEQLKEPLILLLFASAVVSSLLGQYDDAISIAVAVLIVTTIAYIQESNSARTLEALAGLVPPRCLVVRSGLPAADVAAADLVQQCSTVSACFLQPCTAWLATFCSSYARTLRQRYLHCSAVARC